MKENFKQFVIELAQEDSPVGDLCVDLLRDDEFNWDWSPMEVREYISKLPDIYGIHLEYAVEKFLKMLDKFYAKG